MAGNGGSKIMTAQQLENIIGEIGATIFREVVRGLATQIVENSPVRTGRLAGAWEVGINSDKRAPSTRLGKEASVNAINKECDSIQTVNDNTKATILNDCGYAVYIEYGTRFMAAQLPVHRALQRLDEIMRAANIKAQLTPNFPIK